MDDEAGIEEPVVERWSEESQRPRGRPQPRTFSPSILSLSGGVMRSRSGNEIDALLARMLQQSESTYIPNIDRNLDFLYISLQLDLIKPEVNESARSSTQKIDLDHRTPKCDIEDAETGSNEHDQ